MEVVKWIKQTTHYQFMKKNILFRLLLALTLFEHSFQCLTFDKKTFSIIVLNFNFVIRLLPFVVHYFPEYPCLSYIDHPYMHVPEKQCNKSRLLYLQENDIL